MVARQFRSLQTKLMNSLQNSEHFTFLKFENRTNGSKDMVLWANLNFDGNFQLFKCFRAQNVLGKPFQALLFFKSIVIPIYNRQT